jgi:hypothetical protein
MQNSADRRQAAMSPNIAAAQFVIAKLSALGSKPPLVPSDYRLLAYRRPGGSFEPMVLKNPVLK